MAQGDGRSELKAKLAESEKSIKFLEQTRRSTADKRLDAAELRIRDVETVLRDLEP